MHSQMFNAVELVGILCKIYLGAIIIILIYFDLIKMHIFNCIDTFFLIQWVSVALAAPWVGLKETSLGTPDITYTYKGVFYPRSNMILI